MSRVEDEIIRKQRCITWGATSPVGNDIVTAELRDGGFVLIIDSQDMETFELFVHDDRYTVPTLHLIPAVDAGLARTAAEVLWRSSPHYRGVELCRDGEQILTMGACEERRPARVGAASLREASAG